MFPFNYWGVENEKCILYREDDTENNQVEQVFIDYNYIPLYSPGAPQNWELSVTVVMLTPGVTVVLTVLVISGPGRQITQ